MKNEVPKIEIEKLSLEQAIERHKAGTLVGVFLMSNDDYHRAPGISKTGALDKVAISPATYRHYVLNPEPPTPAMEFGSAAHTLILEPEKFASMYAVAPPELDRRGTKKWEAFEAENPGKIILKEMGEQGFATMDVMAQAARAHSRSALLEGYKELTFFCKHPETGLLLKCKLDVLTLKGVITDYKTTASLAYPGTAWAKEVYRRRYHVGAAFYLDVVLHALDQAKQTHLFPAVPKSFVLYAQEKTEPFLVKPWAVGESSIALGRRTYEANLRTILECDQKKSWPGYPEKIEVIDVPEYAFNEELEEVEEGLPNE